MLTKRHATRMFGVGVLVLLSEMVVFSAIPYAAHTFAPDAFPSAQSDFWLCLVIPDLICVSIGIVMLIGGVIGLLLLRRGTPCGQCQTCGYDLTGLSENRCPECGSPFVRMVER